ncbi:testis-expressed protein 10 homolog [Planococcus citri]|uniref:testis-expressed protein 10 homolog n=1 Tax=Planococcus citri TaxID=170843 RepID=UPI0031FA25ED
MGKFAKKTPFQKRKKEDKTKTKLKVSHKTILPKGQNITNTTFKVKKIVVKGQLKEHQEEVATKSNLNVKELISRFHHHNAPLRINALNGLCEVVNDHTDAVLSLNLPAVLHAASNLILDKEHEVRSEAIKLLSTVLSKATQTQLTPLFEIIIKYLACAMSHIDANIRESSLTMLDILISKCPNLTASLCQPVILPAFLDLISTKFSESDRKLTLQFNKKMTTNIWRIKVLARLRLLLEAIVNVQSQRKSEDNTPEHFKRLKWSDTKPTYASLYYRPFDAQKNIDLSRVPFNRNSTQINETDEIKNYTGTLIPLLVEIFIEVAPQKKGQHTGQHLSNDGAVLLKFITDILLLLWRRFEISDSPCHLKKWFCDTFSSSIVEHLIEGRFPYSLAENFQRNKPLSIAGLSSDHSKFLNDKNCMELNANICNIYLSLFEYTDDHRELKNVVRFVNTNLKTCRQLERETVVKLLRCVDSIFCSDIQSHKNKFDAINLVKIIKELYEENSCKHDAQSLHIAEKTFVYLYKVALNQRNNSLMRECGINEWLESLPKLLTEKKIPYQNVKCISNIARCDLLSFSDSLDGYIETILDNLPRIEIVTEKKTDRAEGKKLIVNLLYYVKTWDKEFVDGLKKAVQNGFFSNLTNHVKDIMDTKVNNV